MLELSCLVRDLLLRSGHCRSKWKNPWLLVDLENVALMHKQSHMTFNAGGL